MSNKKPHKQEEDATPPVDDESVIEAESVDESAEEPAEVDLQQDRDNLLSRLQRLSADYLNYQKRVQRDIETAREFANEQLIKDLLGMLDDMERALAAAQENHESDDPLLTGMQLVHDKALETLGRFGLTIVESAGLIFDPDKHAAVMQQPSEEHPPMTVLQEVQKGYQLKGRTIRPATVIVAKNPDDEPKEPKESTEPEESKEDPQKQ